MKKTPRLVVYRDKKREWRWRLLASNSRIIADSGEGYKTKTGAAKAMRRVALVFLRLNIMQRDGLL